MKLSNLQSHLVSSLNIQFLQQFYYSKPWNVIYWMFKLWYECSRIQWELQSMMKVIYQNCFIGNSKYQCNSSFLLSWSKGSLMRFNCQSNLSRVLSFFKHKIPSIWEISHQLHHIFCSFPIAASSVNAELHLMQVLILGFELAGTFKTITFILYNKELIC